MTVLLLVVGSAIYYQPWFALADLLRYILPVALVLILLLSFIFIPIGYVADRRKRYALRENDLHFKSGLVFQKLVSQPITRIQHIEIKRGPFERYKKVASLHVFSAGGAQYTFEIPGLPLQTAKNIHQFILSHNDLTQHD